MSISDKPKTLSGAIIDEIRQAILSGYYPAGSQLRQDALAETHGVSRIPVREALFQLEAEGLVRIVPQKGAVVSDLSVAEINDVFELRAMLEPRLLLSSAPQLDAQDFKQLDNIQEVFLEATSHGRVELYGQLNAQLHMALYQRSNLPKSRQIVISLLQTSERYTRLQLSSPEAMNRAMREHRDMINLCRTREFDKAAFFLRGHIETVREDLLTVIESHEAAKASKR